MSARIADVPVASETVAELRRLQSLARRVNGATPADSALRVASVELAALLAALKDDGAPIRQLAGILGVSVRGVYFRLGRHGYWKLLPSQPAIYKGQPSDHIRNKKETCLRGHLLSGENVRFINGDPARRICRLCERIRCGAYRARKAVAS